MDFKQHLSQDVLNAMYAADKDFGKHNYGGKVSYGKYYFYLENTNFSKYFRGNFIDHEIFWYSFAFTRHLKGRDKGFLLVLAVLNYTKDTLKILVSNSVGKHMRSGRACGTGYEDARKMLR